MKKVIIKFLNKNFHSLFAIRNLHRFKPSAAFTLAEIIIVLGIIGVVASMTIPNLVQNYQKTQYVTALKKTYATFNQALMKMAADEGCPGDLSCAFDSTDMDIMGAKIAKYFNVAKTCTNAPLQTGCFINKYNMYTDNTAPWVGADRGFRFMTNDGVTIRISDSGIYENCNYKTVGIRNICIFAVYIDVNGLKKPNTAGRDIYQFFILRFKGLTPLGGKDEQYWKTNDGCTIESIYGTKLNKSGAYCGGRIIDEGWEMNY